MLKVSGGKCVFDVPGIIIDEIIEVGNEVESDTRGSASLTVHNTSANTSRPDGLAPAGTIGHRLEDVGASGQVDVVSGILPGHEGRLRAWDDFVEVLTH